MSKKSPKWSPPPGDLRFRTTEYVVDASHEQTHEFWYKYHMLHGVKFDQDSMGYMERIGTINGRPICVTVFWYIIEDLFRVAFVDGTSQLVDYAMIEEWERDVFHCLQQPDGMRNRHSDAGNFGNIIGDIQRRLKKVIMRRDYLEIEKAVQKIPLRERPYGEG